MLTSLFSNFKLWDCFLSKGLFVRILDTLDRIICKACPFIAGGVLVGSVYWTAVTFGAITIMQVLGHKEGLNVMEKADPLIMLFGLPLIPLTLIGGRHIPWEDEVLRLWRKHSTKLPLVNLIFNPSGKLLCSLANENLLIY